MNPYRPFVDEIARLLAEGKDLPKGGLPPAPHPTLIPEAPTALLFSPHPDDECIVGALPLRLLREARMRVANVAVTQGSKKERQAGRLAELEGACAFLGFGLMTTAEGGLERIHPLTRGKDPAHWQVCVEVISRMLAAERPRVIVLPHEDDANSTHVGTNALVMDALRRQSNTFSCYVVESEYWRAMAAPNLMVESDHEDVANLVAATAFHVGEVKRNAYHLGLPAWMHDNVRRGGELVGVQGGAAPAYTFATLYRARRFYRGQLAAAWEGGRLLACGDDPGALFPSVT